PQAGTFTLLFGFVAGFIIFLFDMGFEWLGGVQYVSDPVNGLGIPFLLQAWWYFCILSVVYVAVSLATPPPKAEQVDGLTWDSPFAFLARSEIRGALDPRLLGAVLVGVLVLLYALVR
ncbi:MAG: sodium:glucose symporter, partial [Chloroflexi bacterium]|nr:sodium:glucose symporter [Chloroflexota bacterium]